MSEDDVLKPDHFPGTNKGFRSAYHCFRMEERNAIRRIETYRRCLLFPDASAEIEFLTVAAKEIGQQTKSRCNQRMFFAVLHAASRRKLGNNDILIGAAHRKMAQRNSRTALTRRLSDIENRCNLE